MGNQVTMLSLSCSVFLVTICDATLTFICDEDHTSFLASTLKCFKKASGIHYDPLLLEPEGDGLYVLGTHGYRESRMISYTW